MDDVSEDALLGGRLRVRQPRNGYRTAIDPIFMAAAVPARDGEMVLDVGSGVGAASLCLAMRVGGCRVFGLEAQAPLVALARENADLNGMAGRVESMIGNLQAPPPRLAPGSFHHVMTNPPYQEADHGTPSPNPSKALANQESAVELEPWMRFCVNMLRPKGCLLVVYRADRLDDLLAALHRKVGEIVILPLWPKLGRPAKRLVLRARKGVATRLTLLPGLVLHQDDGSYTADAQAVLAEAAALA